MAEPDPGSPPPGLPGLALDQIVARVGRALAVERVTLADFIREAWRVIEPGERFVPNWHIDLISEYLMAVHHRQIQNLDINMPPRLGKSTIVSVCFPCWEWTEDPTLRYLFSSYAQKQCNRDSLKRREIIQSPWYQNRWGELVRLAPDQNLKTEFKNLAQGHMITAPVGGSATGTGGRRLVTDDLIDPRRAESALLREASIAFLRGTLSTRLDGDDAAHINVQQRLHSKDVSGVYCREEDGYTKLVIPLEAPARKVYVFPISKREKVYEAGEILCPERRGDKAMAKLKRDLGPRGVAAQLQQNPEKEAATGFKRSWWKRLAVLPETVLRTIHVYDTAVKEQESNDPSAGIKILEWEKGFVLVPILNERLVFPDLRRAVANQYMSDRPDVILIEDKSSGQQLLQELAVPAPHEGRPQALPVVGTDADFNKLDKASRAATVMGEWAAGNVYYLDDGNPLNETMIEQYAFFPHGDHKDIVDAGVHGVHYLRQSRFAASSGPDEDYEEAEDINNI